MRIFRPLLQRGQQTFRTRFFFFVGIIVKSIKSKGGPENLSLTVRQRAAYFTANRVFIISLIIVTRMQLVFHELVVPYSSYNAIKSTPPSSCLKSALFVSLIPIMLLSSTSLAGLTLLPAFPTVPYAAQVEIQNSNGISWYDKALAINQNNIPALVQRGTDLVNQGKYELAIVSLDKH
jgi:hypothetical protein